MRWVAVILGVGALALAGCGSDAPKGNADLRNPTPATSGGDTNPTACQPGDAKPPLDPAAIKGKELSQAQTIAAKKGYTLRPVVIDGEPQAVTMDYSKKRINVELKDGKVVAFCGVG